MTIKSRKTSEIISEIVTDCDRDGTMTLQEFLNKMGHRALALAILVFALMAMVAGAIPGFSTITGIPIIFMASQIMLCRKTIWLPHSLYSKTLSPRLVHRSLSRTLRPLRHLEKLLKPRALWLTSKFVEPFLGVILFVLAIILSLPIPGGNLLPSSAICILALAILERDGLLVMGALTMIALTGGIMLELIYYAWHYAQLLWQSVF